MEEAAIRVQHRIAGPAFDAMLGPASYCEPGLKENNVIRQPEIFGSTKTCSWLRRKMVGRHSLSEDRGWKAITL